MRILLDEDVDIRFRLHFPASFEVETVAFRGWSGIRNGTLLRRAASEYDALITLDTNLPHQQNLAGFDLAVLILRPRMQTLGALEGLLPDVLRRLEAAVPGTVTVISS